MQPRFDRSRRDLQNLGDLAIVTVLNVPQHDDRPKFLLQFAEGLLNLLLDFGMGDPSGRIRGRRVRPRLRRVPLGRLARRGHEVNPSPFSTVTEARVHRNSKEPGIEAAPSAKPGQIFIRLDEHLLHHVAGVLGRSDQPIHRVIEPLLVTLDDLAEDGGVAPDDLIHEFLVGRAAAGSKSDRQGFASTLLDAPRGAGVPVFYLKAVCRRMIGAAQPLFTIRRIARRHKGSRWPPASASGSPAVPGLLYKIRAGGARGSGELFDIFRGRTPDAKRDYISLARWFSATTAPNK